MSSLNLSDTPQQLFTQFDFASRLRAAMDDAKHGSDDSEGAELSLDTLPPLVRFSPSSSPLSSLSSSVTSSRAPSPEPVNSAGCFSSRVDEPFISHAHVSPHLGQRSSSVCKSVSRGALVVATRNVAVLHTSPPILPTAANITQILGTCDSTPRATDCQQPLSRKRQRAKESHKKRKSRKKLTTRQEGLQFEDAFAYRVRPSLSLKYAHDAIVRLDFDVATLPHASTGYIGLAQPNAGTSVTLNGLLRDGYQLLQWDGIRPILITDKESRIMIILIGRPTTDNTWDRTAQEVDAALANAHDRLHFGQSMCLPELKSCKVNRRGNFKTVAAGVSYGGGQMRPGNLKHTSHNQRVIDELLRNEHLLRMVGFTNAALAYYAPRVYDYYRCTLSSLYSHDTRLRRIFRGSLYPAISCNFGPTAYSVSHTDMGNLAGGLCMITSGGTFNSKTGGHLYFPQLRLVVEFPASSSVGIPSAVLEHGNVPVQEGETRTSITQYAAGGLFRWVEYDFRSKKSVVKSDPLFAELMAFQDEERWRESLDRFSKIEELHQDRMKVFWKSR